MEYGECVMMRRGLELVRQEGSAKEGHFCRRYQLRLQQCQPQNLKVDENRQINDKSDKNAPTSMNHASYMSS
jgi:hypothetical protein